MWLYCTYYGPKLLVLACPQLWSWQVHCQKELLSDLTVLPLFDSLFWSKPSLKIRTARAIFWNYLGIFRDYGLKNIFFRKKTFLFFKIESWNCQHLFEKVFRETSQNFNDIRKITIVWKFQLSIFKNKKVFS